MSKEKPNLSKLEMQIMKPFWEHEVLSIREASEHLAASKAAPDYSTVQTIAGRLEKKGALMRTRKIGNAWLFKAAMERNQIVGGLIDDLMGLLGGASSPIMTYLVESDKIGRGELEEIEQMIAEKENSRKRKGRK